MANQQPTDPGNEDAPFGYNDDGTVLVPYGLKANGKPRITNRGRRVGSETGTATGTRTSTARRTAKSAAKSETDASRKSALLLLSDSFIVTPLVGASTSPFIEKRIGVKQTDALAGDAVIWSHYAPALADGLIMYSEQKPQILAWLDGVEEKAPLIFIGQVLVQMTKGFIGNHQDPNADIAKAGRRLARLNVAKMAAAINAEAEAMGIPTEEQIQAQVRQEADSDATAAA